MKVLILRFSAFGDIVQCMSVLKPLQRQHPDIEMGWATKAEFSSLVAMAGVVSKHFSLEKKGGISSLWRMAGEIAQWHPDAIYDAHQIPRTHLLRLMLFWRGWRGRFIRRPKDRWKRLLLFQFRHNLFPKPFRGMHSYGAPLVQAGLLNSSWTQNIEQSWNFSAVDQQLLQHLVPDLEQRVALVPSAAWEMKRWPLAHWRQLISSLPDVRFVVLGGPQDHFCQELVAAGAKDQVINLAGKLNLVQSCLVMARARMSVSADTGLIHVADLLSRRGLCLIGPTAFGFTTSPNIRILEKEFDCRPCSKDGRGTCTRAVYQECMTSITPAEVAKELDR